MRRYEPLPLGLRVKWLRTLFLEGHWELRLVVLVVLRVRIHFKNILYIFIFRFFFNSYSFKNVFLELGNSNNCIISG